MITKLILFTDEAPRSPPTTDHAQQDHVEPQGFTPVGTAFARPLALSSRDNSSYSVEEDSRRSCRNNGTFQISPLNHKHYPSFSQSSFDRPTFLPQYVNTYSDFMTGGGALTSSRIPSYVDSNPQTYGPVAFNNTIQNVGPYWPDTRTHSSITDPYSYSLNKFHPSHYDNFSSKNSLMLGGSYQDTLGRPTLESTRSYYRSTHDNIPGIFAEIICKLERDSQISREKIR